MRRGARERRRRGELGGDVVDVELNMEAGRGTADPAPRSAAPAWQRCGAGSQRAGDIQGSEWCVRWVVSWLDHSVAWQCAGGPKRRRRESAQ